VKGYQHVATVLRAPEGQTIDPSIGQSHIAPAVLKLRSSRNVVLRVSYLPVPVDSREAAKDAKIGVITCNSHSDLAVLKLRSCGTSHFAPAVLKLRPFGPSFFAASRSSRETVY
jgi:hypothetical protein